VPSAILPEEIPQALRQLRGALQEEPPPHAASEGEEPPVSLSSRAYPLVKMLEASLAEECEVMWE
jgi:hypothetical protein